MKATDIDSVLIEGYLKLLDNLSPASKLDLISRLTLSVKEDIVGRKRDIKEAFGAWDTEKSAEEIIAEIRESRKFNP